MATVQGELDCKGEDLDEAHDQNGCVLSVGQHEQPNDPPDSSQLVRLVV